MDFSRSPAGWLDEGTSHPAGLFADLGVTSGRIRLRGTFALCGNGNGAHIVPNGPRESHELDRSFAKGSP
ncbi:hypothetical protein GCM10009754_60750 [Amycolatopsis minnesotensis]|uniref:Uncharacterized protein n=1 Tax=Amycolatopsis minnesotensis TaxID=337894 RepID=A0ABP5DAS8_9PSEU